MTLNRKSLERYSVLIKFESLLGEVTVPIEKQYGKWLYTEINGQKPQKTLWSLVELRLTAFLDSCNSDEQNRWMER